MSFFNQLFIPFLMCLFLIACGKNTTPATEEPPTKGDESTPVADPTAPPLTWREHWFEHEQLLTRQFYDDSVVVYYDDDMDPHITWPRRVMKKIWNYTWQTYGAFGDSTRLFVILHAGKYGGGHPSTYFDDSHDLRNVIDVGQNNSWADSTGWNLDIVAHEVGHIVEGASKNTHNSPAFGIWHDSKWMEIYQYDVYKKLGWDQEAQRWYNDKMTTVDSYPRANTLWFKNWFYPIYHDHGETAVLNNYFKLLSQYFPKHSFGGGRFEYERDLNFGEFIHFWSGAAGTSLKDLALNAFGEKDEQGNNWVSQFEQAKIDFPQITYE